MLTPAFARRSICTRFLSSKKKLTMFCATTSPNPSSAVSCSKVAQRVFPYCQTPMQARLRSFHRLPEYPVRKSPWKGQSVWIFSVRSSDWMHSFAHTLQGCNLFFGKVVQVCWRMNPAGIDQSFQNRRPHSVDIHCISGSKVNQVSHQLCRTLDIRTIDCSFAFFPYYLCMTGWTVLWQLVGWIAAVFCNSNHFRNDIPRFADDDLSPTAICFSSIKS